MNIIEAIVLGIIQGITEFFPVSSSGHLQLGQHLFGLNHTDEYIFFNLICHLGTLAALVIVFFKEIQQALLDRTRFLQVVIGTLPLFPLVFLMKPIKAIFAQPYYLGYCFLITALLLYVSTKVKNKESKRPIWKDSFYIGLFQAVAILPGISRSGATITAGKLVGWKHQEAITFSFLLAIPAILGGVFLESIQLYKQTETASLGVTQYASGFLASFVMGYFALKWLIKIADRGKWHYFIWYCIFIGICSILYFT